MLENVFLGFPTSHVAFISSEGIIDDFSVQGVKNTSFPKISMGSFEAAQVCYDEITKPGIGEHTQFNMFGFGEQRYLYIIQTNLNADVIKVKVDDGKNGHIRIPDSKIPNLHSANTVEPGLWKLGKSFHNPGSFP